MATECKRRKEWVAKFHRRQHRKKGPESHQTQSHTPEPEPASPEEVAALRRATAQPSRLPTDQERRDAHVERWIVPWAYGVCLRIKSIRNARCFEDSVDLLTAHAECQPHYEDELKRLAELADEIFHPTTENSFTRVREKLEAMNAREADDGRNSDEYVAAELHLYYLTGEWGLNLTGDELFGLVNEVEGCLEALDNALRNSV